MKGFTLLEILLSVALIGILAVISAPVFQNLQTRNGLDISQVLVVQNLRRAQALSQAVTGDATWGVKIQSSSLTVFKGESYSARTSSFDEVSNFPINISVSGADEVVFSKLSGYPQTTGTITLVSNTNETRTITINEKGNVSY
jgi:prepilin-type N-terminal cleavage/methylation domain-containing protein